MAAMRGRLALAVVCCAVLGGCSDEPEKLPLVCLEGEHAYQQALRAAPGEVRLQGDTPISDCVRRGSSQADAQNVGVLLLRVADREVAALPRSDAAAQRLGFLVGATRRGAERTNGLQIELARRLEQVVGLDGPPRARRPAYLRGVRAGRDHG